ncbi:serine threonine protein kinase [Stylonychia lemnae]|uniref:Casein kinase I n=1 Tax=Stylonychia lemnae TaxID=5949 RepID=A0A078AFM2_STYLE|nr:serine threonine protein kinase [Stylonychia lemnae]|eukprot:CDW79713.1 serine threonine protein kinase [Stylonychia lemnae]
MIQSSNTTKQGSLFLNIEKQTDKSKKKTRKSLSKGRPSKSKKQKQISPVGKTQSTESTYGQSQGNEGKDDQQNDIERRRTSKKSIKKNRVPKDDPEVIHDDPLLEYKSNKTAHMNLLGKRFKIEDEMLGFGSFGRTYLGQDIKRKKRVAIKIMLKKKSMDSFVREATVLKSVNYLKHPGFPKMLMSAYNEDICILVEELLGQNLETLRKKYGRLSLAVVCSIGIQLDLHNCGFIHRDIKPQNILLGSEDPEKANKVYLIDFGLSISYLENETGKHYKENPNHNYSNVVGTALFASINAHNGRDLSRRDDIESLVYTLIYLCQGTLPWKNINEKKKKERHQIIMFMKDTISSSRDHQQNLNFVPVEIFQMLSYCQELQFDDKPNYTYLKKLLQEAIKRNYSIRRINDIDLLKNNNEESKKVNNMSMQSHLSLMAGQLNSFSKEISLNHPLDNVNQQNALIDIDSIAFNFGFNKNGAADHESDNLVSVQSNEQLAFRSEIDGRSNQNDYKDEIMNKINPSMFRQIFNGNVDENIKIGQLIEEIPEVEEDDSYGEQDDDEEGEEDPDEESKLSPLHAKYRRKSIIKRHKQRVNIEEQEDECEDVLAQDNIDVNLNCNNQNNDGDGDGGEEDDEDEDIEMDCEEDIPDDNEVSKQISGYSLKANDNNLKGFKGIINQVNTQ